MFTIGYHTVGPISTKFGKNKGFYPGSIFGYVLTSCPPPPMGVPLEVGASQTVHFWENVIKHKSQNTPDLITKIMMRK